MRNLDNASAELLTDIAKFCFLLGVEHARRRQRRITAQDLLDSWRQRFGVESWRRFHTSKFRQVYGAGYDMAYATDRLSA